MTSGVQAAVTAETDDVSTGATGPSALWLGIDSPETLPSFGEHGAATGRLEWGLCLPYLVDERVLERKLCVRKCLRSQRGLQVAG